MRILIFKEKKFIIDVLFNILTFGLVGASGILINFLINNYYGSNSLGVYNQAFSIYLIFSIISIFGVQYSMIYNTSKNHKINEVVTKILISGYLSSIVSSFLASILLYTISFNLYYIFGSNEIHEVLPSMILALPFYTLNKITQGHLNGLRKMQLLGLMQIIRIISQLCLLTFFIYYNKPLKNLGFCILFSEIIVLSISLFFVKKHLLFIKGFSYKWIKTHLNFGAKSFMFSAASEINTKIDILILGAFASNSIVGVYSFYSEFLKGLLGFSNVIQINLSPLITRLWTAKKYEELNNNLRNLRNYTYLIFISLTLILVFLVPNLLFILNEAELYLENINIFYILILGILIYSGIDTYNGFLVRIGEPLNQLKIELTTLFFNLIFNIILVNLLGVMGVAISTTLSFVLFSLLVYYSAKRKLSLKR